MARGASNPTAILYGEFASRSQSNPVPAQPELLQMMRAGSPRADLYDDESGSEGVKRLQAAVYFYNLERDEMLTVPGEWTDVAIPGDEESYDSALSYAVSTAIMEVEHRLTKQAEQQGLSLEALEEELLDGALIGEWLDEKIDQSDVPVF